MPGGLETCSLPVRLLFYGEGGTGFKGVLLISWICFLPKVNRRIEAETHATRAALTYIALSGLPKYRKPNIARTTAKMLRVWYRSNSPKSLRPTVQSFKTVARYNVIPNNHLVASEM